MNQDIDLTKIKFGRNYREDFNISALQDLADNMRENGQHTPVIVRPTVDGGYELIAGERRIRAAMLNNWATIRADVVEDMNEDTALAITLSENMCRVQTNAIEDARGFARLVELGWSVEMVSKAAGVRVATVRDRLALRSLRADVQKLVADGGLGLAYANILADAKLDSNRQLLALVRMRENPVPTPRWFRGIVNELLTDQAQDVFELTLTCQNASELSKVAATLELPPLPSKDKPPQPPLPYKNARGVPKRFALAFYVSFWQDARARWQELGKRKEVAECEGAIAGLEQALAWM